jgi:predicted RNase H-like nuclease (RuvC/YqgF family)
VAQIGEIRKELDCTLTALQEDYNQCVKVIRKTYNYLEQVGIKEFNKYAKYKWSLDRDKGYSYVCVRYGSSLHRKSLIKSSGLLDDADLYKWIENKDLICEALDEACEYIRDKVKLLKRRMEETKSSMMEYEEKLNDLNEELEEAQSAGSKVMRQGEENPRRPAGA